VKRLRELLPREGVAIPFPAALRQRALRAPRRAAPHLGPPRGRVHPRGLQRGAGRQPARPDLAASCAPRWSACSTPTPPPARCAPRRSASSPTSPPTRCTARTSSWRAAPRRLDWLLHADADEREDVRRPHARHRPEAHGGVPQAAARGGRPRWCPRRSTSCPCSRPRAEQLDAELGARTARPRRRDSADRPRRAAAARGPRPRAHHRPPRGHVAPRGLRARWRRRSSPSTPRPSPPRTPPARVAARRGRRAPVGRRTALAHASAAPTRRAAPPWPRTTARGLARLYLAVRVYKNASNFELALTLAWNPVRGARAHRRDRGCGRARASPPRAALGRRPRPSCSTRTASCSPTRGLRRRVAPLGQPPRHRLRAPRARARARRAAGHPRRAPAPPRRRDRRHRRHRLRHPRDLRGHPARGAARHHRAGRPRALVVPLRVGVAAGRRVARRAHRPAALLRGAHHPRQPVMPAPSPSAGACSPAATPRATARRRRAQRAHPAPRSPRRASTATPSTTRRDQILGHRALRLVRKAIERGPDARHLRQARPAKATPAEPLDVRVEVDALEPAPKLQIGRNPRSPTSTSTASSTSSRRARSCAAPTAASAPWAHPPAQLPGGLPRARPRDGSSARPRGARRGCPARALRRPAGPAADLPRRGHRRVAGRALPPLRVALASTACSTPSSPSPSTPRPRRRPARCAPSPSTAAAAPPTSCCCASARTATASCRRSRTSTACPSRAWRSPGASAASSSAGCGDHAPGRPAGEAAHPLRARRRPAGPPAPRPTACASKRTLGFFYFGEALKMALASPCPSTTRPLRAASRCGRSSTSRSST
jgi:hypothetical protein